MINHKKTTDFIDWNLLFSHLGETNQEWNSLLTPYLIGTKNNVNFFNIDDTKKSLIKALLFLYKITKNQGHILIINTIQPYISLTSQIHFTLRNIFQSKNQSPFVSFLHHHWVGGLLTNWDQVSLSIQAYQELEAWIHQKETQISKTKPETLFRNYSYNSPRWKKMKKSFSKIYHRPDVIILLSTNPQPIVIKEAIRANIPVITFIDSNYPSTYINNITFPILANPHSLPLLHFFLQSLIKIQLSCLK